MKSRVELTTVELSQVWTPETSKGGSLPVRSTGTTRSSTWSFGSPSPRFSIVATESSRTETVPGDITQEQW